MDRVAVLIQWAIVGLLLATVAGCGNTGQLKIFSVTGTVTYDGKPMVGGGSISFMPMSGKETRSAGGTIQADGSYTLMTYSDGDGAAAGEYRVVITQVTEQEGENRGDESTTAPKATSMPTEDRIPANYSAQDSPLTTKVEPKTNRLDFDLKRQK